MNELIHSQHALLSDVRVIIDQARKRLAISVNSSLTLLYWDVGSRIQSEVLKDQRAEYGKQVIATVSQQLSAEYGKGWGERQLWNCLGLVNRFPDRQILNTLCAELSWSHFRLLLAIDDTVKRDFYIEICRLEHWSVRQLQERVRSLLFERTAISRKPDETIRQEIQILRQSGELSPDLTFRDPYVLDFLGLADTFSEKDLESAIVAELQRFICELGGDFGFLARQKRITIDQRDYFIDLLFFHRRLKCLIVIDLKIGDFDAAYKGEMELYLRYLEKYEQLEGENTPIGLILCAGKNAEHIELLRLEQSNIRVAEYLTALPPYELLREKLHRSIELARQRLTADPNEKGPDNE